MRILFIGCVEFSYKSFKYLLSLPYPNLEIVGVITRKESPGNADFQSLEALAKENDIPCFLANKNDQDSMADWIKKIDIDVIYCFGWSYLLKKEILSQPKLGVIGFHPAALPRNRGRHPIIWALAMGLKETASTFFIMDEGADSGDIISQKPIPIDYQDNAGTLYKKITQVALQQIGEFTKDLIKGIHNRKQQEHSQANYWRKRSKKDGEIDWRMSANSVYNLVRALYTPYPGAHCISNEREIKIWEVKPYEVLEEYENHEPGKVLKVKGSEIFVKCGEGAVTLIKHEFDDLPKEGSYL
jgi:methionyl-tRNA formyltransferase